MEPAFKPASEAELVDAVQSAIATQTPLEIIGTGTKRNFGRPMQTARTLAMSGFSGIEVYEPEELVLTAGAGTPLAEIEAALSKRQQMLAFEPPNLSRLLEAAHGGTLGGTLACNLAGPRRIKVGAARDHILGFAGVSGRGEAFKAGGRVVKNVTGYDLAKLMAGSFGTLVALTSLTFKVLPRPEAEETLCFEGLDDHQAAALMSLAMQSSADVSGAAHVPKNLAGALGMEEAATFLRLEGFAPSIAVRRDNLRSLLQPSAKATILRAATSARVWGDIRDVHPLCDGVSRAVWRISVPPSDGAPTLERIKQSLDVRGYYDWAGGLLWLDAPLNGDAGAKTIRSALRSGHATLIRAPNDIRAHVDVFQPQEPSLAALSKRVKASFDPYGLFNPRRMSANA